jgi:hypothetical protein
MYFWVEVRRFSQSSPQKTLQLVVGDDNATVVLILKRVGANVGVETTHRGSHHAAVIHTEKIGELVANKVGLTNPEG